MQIVKQIARSWTISGMKTQSLISLLCLSACVAAGSLFLREPRSESSSRLLGASRPAPIDVDEYDGLPGPLIQTDSAYLNGRGVWLTEYFNRIFVEWVGPDAPTPAAPRVTIHRRPFSDGPWLGELKGREVADRTSTETQTVEAEFGFELEGVSAERLLQFLVFSDYAERVDGIGELERERLFPPLEARLPELDEDLVIAPNQFVVREHTQRPELLAQPTGCTYLFDARRFGDAYLLRYDLLANSQTDRRPGEEPAIVRLSAGQYAIAPTRAGARLHHIAFYSGQSVPSLFDEFVRSQTAQHLQSMADTIRSLAPGWEAPSEAERWLKTALE